MRGGILDLFPPAHPQPLRIELVGDVIEAIREFDPVSQRSLESRPEFVILPVREFDAHGRTQRDALRAIEARALDLELRRDERSQILDGLTTGRMWITNFPLPASTGPARPVPSRFSLVSLKSFTRWRRVAPPKKLDRNCSTLISYAPAELRP